jgi:hypothetical protein
MAAIKRGRNANSRTTARAVAASGGWLRQSLTSNSSRAPLRQANNAGLCFCKGLSLQLVRGTFRRMASALLTLTDINEGVVFYHPYDERAFFEWLARIPCVASYDVGEVILKRRPGQDDLRQLLALFHRYGVDMRQLAKFESAKNRSWFSDPIQYWHHAVFGGTSHPS